MKYSGDVTDRIFNLTNSTEVFSSSWWNARTSSKSYDKMCKRCHSRISVKASSSSSICNTSIGRTCADSKRVALMVWHAVSWCHVQQIPDQQNLLITIGMLLLYLLATLAIQCLNTKITTNNMAGNYGTNIHLIGPQTEMTIVVAKMDQKHSNFRCREQWTLHHIWHILCPSKLSFAHTNDGWTGGWLRAWSYVTNVNINYSNRQATISNWWLIEPA